MPKTKPFTNQLVKLYQTIKELKFKAACSVINLRTYLNLSRLVHILVDRSWRTVILSTGTSLKIGTFLYLRMPVLRFKYGRTSLNLSASLISRMYLNILLNLVMYVKSIKSILLKFRYTIYFVIRGQLMKYHCQVKHAKFFNFN